MNWLNPTEKLKAYWKIFGLAQFFIFWAVIYWAFNQNNVDQFNYFVYFSSVLTLVAILCLYQLYTAYLQKENMIINIFVATICISVSSASLHIVYIGLINATPK